MIIARGSSLEEDLAYADQRRRANEFLAEVELEYRLHDVRINPRLIGDFHSSHHINFTDPDQYATIPFIAQSLLKAPKLKKISIELHKLTEEFVTKSVNLPEWLEIRIEPGRVNTDDDSSWGMIDPVENPDFSMLGKFKGLTNVSIWDIKNNVYNDSLEKALYGLPQLKRLALNINNMDKIPEPILRMKDLRYLDLSWSKISEIPKGISNLENLEYLAIVNHNKPYLHDIRKLGSLPKLNELHVYMGPYFPYGKTRIITHKPAHFDLLTMAIPKFNFIR